MYRFSRYSRLSIAPIALAAAAAALIGLATPLTAHADERLAEWNFDGPSPYSPINGEHSFGFWSAKQVNSFDDLRVIDSSVGNPGSSLTISTLARTPAEAYRDTNGSYIRLDLAPESGYMLNLTSFSFDVAINYNPLGTWNANGLASGGVSVYGNDPAYSGTSNKIDSFATLLGGGIVADTTQDNLYSPFFTVKVDLTRPRYQGLEGVVSFLLFVSSSGESDLRGTAPFTPSDIVAIDNVRINGTAVLIRAEVAAPEPGSFALLLPVVGVVGRAIRRRRR